MNKHYINNTKLLLKNNLKKSLKFSLKKHLKKYTKKNLGELFLLFNNNYLPFIN